MAQIVNRRKRSRWSDDERNIMLTQLQLGLSLERISENLNRTTGGIASQFAAMCISQKHKIQQLQQQYPHLNITNIILQHKALDSRREKIRKSEPTSTVVKNEEAVLAGTPTESLHTVMTQLLEELKEIKTILREQKSKSG